MYRVGEFIYRGTGTLYMSPRPKSYTSVAQVVDTVVICLEEREGLSKLRLAAENVGLYVIPAPFICKHFPANPATIQDAVYEAAKRLSRGSSVLVHCSAGIHRTGLVAYAITRLMGVSRSEAVRMVVEARPVCKDAVRFIEKYGEMLSVQ